MAKPIIGFDFGNFYSQLCCIMDMDPRTRRGGNSLDLQDPTSPNPNGIPSAFFYSSKRNNGQPCCGHQAERSRPLSNIVRYMKRNMRKSVTLDGRTFTYGEIITQTAEYCIRLANRQLHAQTQQTTNLVSLAYPVGFEAADRAYLVSCIEKATLEDGTRVKVVGTITEPAAAALDYLADHPGSREATTVMAYDLGAGTFDLSVVKVYPGGKQGPDGKIYYYETLWSDGIVDLGGREFDKIVYDIIVSKMGTTPKGSQVDTYMSVAETTKRELTNSMEVYPGIVGTDEDYSDLVITRGEFEKLAAVEVKRTVKMVERALTLDTVPRPDLILLTGGASQMPIVLRSLVEAFPAYRDKIVFHRPSKAIAMGAARYGTEEADTSVQVLLQRTTLDLGIRHYKDLNDSTGYITTQVPRNTPLPLQGEVRKTYTLGNQRYLLISVYEAKTTSPNRNRPTQDYRHVIAYTHDFGKAVAPGTPVCHQIVIDKDNMLYLHVWEPDNKAATLQTVKCTYESAGK